MIVKRFQRNPTWKRVDTKKFCVLQNNDYESFLTHVVVESLEEILFYTLRFFQRNLTSVCWNLEWRIIFSVCVFQRNPTWKRLMSCELNNFLGLVPFLTQRPDYKSCTFSNSCIFSNSTTTIHVPFLTQQPDWLLVCGLYLF